MREPISLKEIIAVVLKRGRGILCVAIALAVLAGAYQFKEQYATYKNPANSAAALESAYQAGKAVYDESVAAWTESIEAAEKKLQQQQAYLDNSVLMQLDPYQVAMHTTILAVTDVEEIYQGAYAQKDISPSYFISKIQDFYGLYWQSLVLTEELAGHSYTDISEQHLRELISVEITNSGTFTITTKADTAENAEKLGDAAYKCLQDMHSIIEENTYAHTLSVITRVTKVHVDEDLELRQKEIETSIEESKKELETLKGNLKSLVVPQKGVAYSMKDVLVKTVLWMIIGAVGGVALACIWILVLFLMRSRVESSRQMEQMVGVPFLGSVAKKGSVWCRLAQKLLGERVWEDVDMASGFVAESVKAAEADLEQLAILTTLNRKDTDDALASVSSAVSTVCGKAVCIKNAEKNPETIALLQTCKVAVLAERISVSEMPEVLALLEIANRMGVKILGFVTV